MLKHSSWQAFIFSSPDNMYQRRAIDIVSVYKSSNHLQHGISSNRFDVEFEDLIKQLQVASKLYIFPEIRQMTGLERYYSHITW